MKNKGSPINKYFLPPPELLPLKLSSKHYVRKERSCDSPQRDSENLSFRSNRSQDRQQQEKKRTLQILLNQITQKKLKLVIKHPITERPLRTINDITSSKVISLLSSKKDITLPGLTDDKFFQRLKQYQSFIFQVQCSHKFYMRPLKTQTYFCNENNEAIKKRWWWKRSLDENSVNLYISQIPNTVFCQKQKVRKQIENEQELFGLFTIQAVEDPMKFAIDNRLTIISPFQKVHNHIMNNNQLLDQKSFVSNLVKFYSLTKRDPYQQIPFSVHIYSFIDPNLHIFLRKYKLAVQWWVVKSGEYSQKSIPKICSSIREAQTYIQSQFQLPNKNHQTFIIQKYIKPLLYMGRKLDLRCHILVTQLNGVVKLYLHKEVIGRTSILPYSNDLDVYIHCTNNKLQQEHEDYNKVKDVQLNHTQLLTYFTQMNINFEHSILPKLQQLALDAFKAAFTRMQVQDHNFELLGMDFLLDQNLKPWVLDCSQINDTQLLDEVYQLTIDPLYPPPLIWPSNRRCMLDFVENKFQIIFDSRSDSNAIFALYS